MYLFALPIVSPPPFLPPVNPAFIAPFPLDQTVNDTENATFTCTAAGIPAPTISFYRGATLLDGAGPEEPNPRVTLEDPTGSMTYIIPENGEEVLQVSRTLTVSNTMDGDSGNYSCRAGSTPTPDEDEVFFQLVVQSKFFRSTWFISPAFICCTSVQIACTMMYVTLSCHLTEYRLL